MDNNTNNMGGGNNNPKNNMPPRNPMPPRRRRGPLSFFYGFWVLMLAALFLMPLFDGSGTPRKIEWNALQNMIVEGDVQKIEVVNDKTARIYLKTEAVEEYRKMPTYKSLPDTKYQFTYNIGNPEIFRTDLEKIAERYGVEVPVPAWEYPSNIWRELVGWMPMIIFAVLMIMMFRSMGRGAAAQNGVMNVGKSRAQVYDKDNANKITFKDVAGLEEAKVEIMEIVDFLRKPEKYRELGGKIPKGALLVGPPGTGKTLLAKAVAGEANVPFFSISGSDFVEMFVGVGASRVRDLFAQAKEKAPCIVFIDEIDAIGRARGKNAGFSGNDERENTLNQLLTEMDGFGTNSGVIVLAATNRVDILDKALLRAGRFDRQIDVGLPELKEREAIFGVHMRKLKLADDVNVEFLAKQTPGFSGADIANVCNEAALIAARNNKKCVERDDFMAAIDRIVGGLEKRNKSMSPAERRATAIHEAGHATVMWRLKECDPVLKVTVIPRGNSLGATWSVPDEERVHVTDAVLQDKLAGLLGGRIAEEVNYGTLGAGALSDLERATKLTYAMVAFYGMSKKIGPISYYDASGTRDTFTKPYSEQTAIAIDNEVRRMLDEAYNRAREIIEQENDKINQMADLLLEKETIYAEDIEPILGKSAQAMDKEEAEDAVQTNESENSKRPNSDGVTVAD